MTVREILLKHKIRYNDAAYLVAVHSMTHEEVGPSNRHVAQYMNKTEQHVGRSLKTLVSNGYLVDTSKHPLRRSWALTPKGQAIVNDFGG